MKRIGIVTDRIRLAKMGRLVAHLGSRAGIAIRVAEEMLVDLQPSGWSVDVVMAKSKDPVALAALKTLEADGIPIVNRPGAIFSSFHRFLLNATLDAAKIPQPGFALSLDGGSPFDPAVAKSHLDTAQTRGSVRIRTGTEDSPNGGPSLCYSQQFVRPDCEYKVYAVGEKLITYRQRLPVIFNPDYRRDKHRGRVLVEVPEVDRIARRAIAATGLAIASLDIVACGGEHYLVDLNATPNLQDDHVIDLLSEYLLELAQ